MSAYICGAVRTPFCSGKGLLSSFNVDALAALPMSNLISRNKRVDWSAVEAVILGCADEADEDGGNTAYRAAVRAGFSSDVIGEIVSRSVNSGLHAVSLSADAILSGKWDLVVAGGVDKIHKDANFLLSANNNEDSCLLEVRSAASRNGLSLDVEAMESLANSFAISREMQDEFALQSRLRWRRAAGTGFFERETMAVRQPEDSNGFVVRADYMAASATSLVDLSKLNPLAGNGGTVTAGNISAGRVGACALLLSSEAAANRYGLIPRVKILAHAMVCVPAEKIGVGSAVAINKVLGVTGLSLWQMDCIELSEDSAVQVLAIIQELDLPVDSERINSNGGSIAVGHPLGATGARLVITAINQLERNGGRYALCAVCDGAENAVAIIIEKIK
ncbi:MAG: acetyl-CoA C-acyltransferase [Gammaproteobacteria bacterium]|nr:acetyl-CoA C-acyltransferase [Gammaproteobacteria bacterium]